MTSHSPIRRRSTYADRLLEFGEFAFVDGRERAQRGAWRTFFDERIGSGFSGQVVFEIGCNDASFLTRVAARHPSTGFIGIDWKCRALHTAVARVATAGLTNVALLHGRAQDLRHFFAVDELDEIWLFHPDPCDKPRELPNRLFSERFLRDAFAVLRSGGSVILKTDHADYFDAACAVAGSGSEVVSRSTDFWNDQDALRRAASHPFAGQTTLYEARFCKKRLPIHYLELQKTPGAGTVERTPSS